MDTMDSLTKASIQEYIRSFRPLYNAFNRARNSQDNRFKDNENQSERTESMDDWQTIRPSNHMRKDHEYKSDRYEGMDYWETKRPGNETHKAYQEDGLHPFQKMHTSGSDNEMPESYLEESTKPLQKMHESYDSEISNSSVKDETELEEPAEKQEFKPNPRDMWPLDKISSLLFCEVCNVPFTTKEYLEEHSKIHIEKSEDGEKSTEEMESNGEICFDESSESFAEEVKPNKKNSKKFVCEFCDKKFKTIDDLSEHSTKHARERTKFIRMFDSELPKPFVCQICGASFAKVYYLTKHEKLHQEKQFQCDICQAKFVRKYTLQIHRLIHSDEKPYKCKVCEAAFTRKGNLVQHSAVHAGEKPFKCTYCDGAFSNKNKLQAHIKMHTGNNLFKCDECGATFELRAKLAKHKQLHSGIRPYSCNVCNASFIYEASLRKHLKKGVHDPNKLFQCHYCDQELTSKLRLENHLKIHTDDKPYKCSYCSAAYAMKCTLQVHQRIHTGERTFKCETCNAVFAQKHSLIVHRRIHTGEKPFKCHICNAAYMQKACLSIHLKLHSTSLDDEALALEPNMTQSDTQINNSDFGGQHLAEEQNRIDETGHKLDSTGVGEGKMYKGSSKMNTICQKIMDEMQDQAHTYEKMKRMQNNMTGGDTVFENTDGYFEQHSKGYREDGPQKSTTANSDRISSNMASKGRKNKNINKVSKTAKLPPKKDLQKYYKDYSDTSTDMTAQNYGTDAFERKSDHIGEYKHFTETSPDMDQSSYNDSEDASCVKNDNGHMNEAAQRVRNWILQGPTKYLNDISEMKSFPNQSESGKDDTE